MSDSDKIIIRSVVSTDIEAIMQIEYESFLPGVREERGLYVKRIALFPQGFLVAQNTDTGEIGGYIASEIWREEQSISSEALALGHDPQTVHDKNGRCLYITSFGTLSSWRGKKIGLALFEALEAKIKTDFPHVIKKILIVSEEWTAARNLYSKKGFIETGRIADFFTPDHLPPQAAVIMMKNDRQSDINPAALLF